MPKMKTLMPDNDVTSPDQDAIKGVTGDTGATTAVAPVENPTTADWLQELAKPCEETVVRTDTGAPTGVRQPAGGHVGAAPPACPELEGGRPVRRGARWPIRLADPLKLHLVRFRQFWSSARAVPPRPRRVSRSGRHSELTEEFLALTVVHLGPRLVPTVSFFGGNKAGAVRQAADTLRKAGTDEWSKMGPAHAASASFRSRSGGSWPR